MRCCVWLAVGAAVASAAGAASADVVYVSQNRSLFVGAGPFPDTESSAALGEFRSELHDRFDSDHGQYSQADGTMYSWMDTGTILMADRISAVDAYGEAGAGGGGGIAIVDAVFRVTTPQRYDFVGVTTMDSSSQWGGHFMTVNLVGAGGTVFEMTHFPFGTTERYSGMLAAGEYHLHMEHNFNYGGSGLGHGEGTFTASLTVPAPGAAAVLGAAALFGRRRRR